MTYAIWGTIAAVIIPIVLREVVRLYEERRK